MSWRIKITASAREDIRNIKTWHATESVKALENFTKELVTVLENLQSNLQENRPVYENYRKISLKKISLHHILSAKRNRKNGYDQCAVSYSPGRTQYSFTIKQGVNDYNFKNNFLLTDR